MLKNVIGLLILLVKFTQNQENKQQHFYSTGKILGGRSIGGKLSWGIRVRILQELNVVAVWFWNLDVVVF